MTAYKPIVTGVRMSDYGYWIVDVSVAPALVTSVMVAVQGISPDDAARLALPRAPGIPERIPVCPTSG